MRKFALVPLLTLLFSVSANAALPAFTLNSISSVANGDFYIGYEFAVSSPQIVSALGVLDAVNSGSLTTNIGVGLYRKPATGNVATHVASVIVPAGTTIESVGARGAFFANITPVTLTAGNYVILADAGTGGKGYGRASFTFRSGISYVQGWFAGSSPNFPGLGADAPLSNASNSGDWASALFKVGDVGSLTGGVTQSRTDNVNLTSLGSTDWAVWGLGTSTSLAPGARKSGVNQISSLTDITTGSPLQGMGQFGQYGQSTFDWTGGATVATATGAFTGLQHNNTTSKINEGFSFTVPASLTAQRMSMYFTVNKGLATITATLSDNSAAAIGRTFDAASVANVAGVFTADFAAGLAGQTLTVSVKLTNAPTADSNVTVQAVTLSPPYTPLSITTTSITGGTAGVPYSAQIAASGGNPSPTWSATGLPAGLSINQSGLISGTPGAAGTFSATVGVTDGVSSASKVLSLNLTAPPISILTTSLPSGQVSQSYGPTTLTASGGYGTFTWSATGLPSGLNISPAGIISGVPGGAGTAQVTVRVTDSLSTSVTKALTISVAPPPLSILTSGLPAGQAGQPYGPAGLSATGGSGNYSWSASGLPQGLGISGTGAISGIPASAGTSNVSVTATDTLFGTAATKSYTISIAVALPSVSGPSNLGNVPVGGAVSGAFSVSGGTAPYRWSISGAPGLTIDGNGTVSGAPTAAGAFTASVLVTDATNNSAGAAATLTVLGIATGSLPPAQTIVDYSATVTAVGGVPPYIYAITGLPTGLSASGATITGRAQTSGSSTVTAKVTDSKGLTVTATYTLTVTGAGPLTVSSNSLQGGSVGQPYSQAVSATGGNPPYTWALTGGALPAGLSLNASGAVSGIPTAAGASSFGVRVTDGSGGQTLGSVAISIEPEPLRITSGTNLPVAYVGVEYPGQTLTASGGVAPYTFSSKGSLPTGLTLTNGVLAGIPTTAGTSNFSVTVSDSSATPITTTASFAISVQQSGGDLVLSSGSVAFSLAAGSTDVPAPASVSISSTSPAVTLGYSVAVNPAAPWLSVTSGNGTPGTLTIGLAPAALTLAEGVPNAASVVVTCTSGACQGKSQSIGVVLNVTAPPPQLSVGSGLISLTATTSNPAAAVATLRVQNSGGGQLTGVTVTSDASWLKAGSAPSSIAPGPGAQVDISASPAGLKAGYYRGTVTVSSAAGVAKVPVALLLSGDSVMTLGPAGAQFTMSEGGAVGKSAASFLVSVNSSSPVTYSAAVQPGANWLVVTSGRGSASSAGPGTVGLAINSTEAATLKAGAYYGTVRVSANGIVNAPQDFQVILNVTPGNLPAQPDPQPAGLLFLTSAAGGSVAPQVVTLYASSRTPVGFQIAADGGAWLTAAANGSATSASSPAQVSVSVNTAGLKAGVYRGGVNVSYTGTAVRTVNVTLVVQPPSSGALAAEEATKLAPRAGPACAGGQLVPAQTGLVSSFAAPASWPTPLAIRLVDSCGSLVPEGQIVATFSNGDPPLGLTLVDARQALYTATWTPRKSTSQISINARATAPGYSAVTSQIQGQVVPNEAPSLEPNGTQDVFNPLVGGGLGPGNIVQIYGSRLASTKTAPTTLPLPTTVFGTKVLIGGVPAPLFFVSPGQINAQVPFELTGGKQYQVVVSANGALTTPQPIQLNQGTPATLQFTSGLIVAQHGDGSLVSETAPAKPGENIVFYMSGLGATDIEVPSGAAAPSDPPARVKDVPKVTLNGVAVPVAFAGLTPGLAGLYQVNVQVPSDLADGTYTVEVSQAEATGNSTSLIVKK